MTQTHPKAQHTPRIRIPRHLSIPIPLALIAAVLLLAAGCSPSTGDLVERGRALFASAGCATCHIVGQYTIGRIGTDLNGIGNRHDAAFIRQSILDPNAVIAEECLNGPCVPGLMPQTYGQQLTNEQIDALVAFLLAQK